MFDPLLKHADLPARALMSGIFILSGIGKVTAVGATQGYMDAFGLPAVLLVPTILFEIGAGLALLVGFKTRFAALLLAGFSIITAVIFHADFGDQIQQIMFLKNVALAGGLLLLAKTGAPALSVDSWFAVRSET